MPPAATQQQTVVELVIPCLPEFVGVARLATLGVASRMAFSYDEVEDIRLAVGEACTRCIERLAGTAAEGAPLRITSILGEDILTIEARVPLTDGTPEAPAPNGSVPDGSELSGVLIDILMDEVESTELPAQGDYLLRMAKRISR